MLVLILYTDNSLLLIMEVNTKEFVPCRGRTDVDNQLGILHDALTNVMKFYNVNITNTHYVNDAHDTGIQYINHSKHNNVFVAHDVIPLSLAQQVRDFLSAIPFDNDKLVINDTDNQPQDKVFTFVNCKGDPEHGLRIKAAYDNAKAEPVSPKEWVWEHYHPDFWRAIPVTPEAFAGSPILTLISVLERQWYNINMTCIWGDKHTLKELHKATWVVQRITKGKKWVGIMIRLGIARFLLFII